MKKKYIMHVVSGTHWDREWRHTAEQSKLRLTDLMDYIIHLLETNERYQCFCVDGGMVVLEDYLTIRPEKKEQIKNPDCMTGSPLSISFLMHINP